MGPIVLTTPPSTRLARDIRRNSARGTLLEMSLAIILHIPSKDTPMPSILRRSTGPPLSRRLLQFLETGPSLLGSGLQRHLIRNNPRVASIQSRKRAIVCRLQGVRSATLPNLHGLDRPKVTISPGIVTTDQKRTLSQKPMSPMFHCHRSTRKIPLSFQTATHSSG